MIIYIYVIFFLGAWISLLNIETFWIIQMVGISVIYLEFIFYISLCVVGVLTSHFYLICRIAEKKSTWS